MRWSGALWCAVTVSFFGLAPRASSAQATEVLLGGLWADGIAAGGYVGVEAEKLIGKIRFEPENIGGETVQVQVARRWVLVGFAALGVVGTPGAGGVLLDAWLQAGANHRFPGRGIDRVGLVADGLPARGAWGLSAVARLKSAVWLQGGAVRDDGAWEPIITVRMQAVLLREVWRFLF